MIAKHKATVRVQARKRVPFPGASGATGFTTVPDGENVGSILVTVDLQRLAALLGPKAMRSKRRVSKIQGGIITVKAVGIVHVEPKS